MENNSFKPGDVVVLKSGSPKMTVSYSDVTETICHYYNFNENKLSLNNRISTVSLELAEN
ncbi:Uncharacterized conserved protein YodC, DUF2158 family [Flavobacterium psychrophilum DSM 3660]|uniref:DUF2158 domain-containing protein n=1 Tax=Flavobacterium psychrophilum TaxID=96345 RepID=UPI0004F72E41|nr:DUF2158 domain-containing protein [Flavobacterium psychrophilum]AIN74116.1 hypothetical protein FPG3_07235 [Flavobacterium psychrophilum FPG3]MBF2044764.1 DUF2158 domain-containing protein [Flavobacterium psychrophilum]OXB07081.1 hypothetical protein B0A57_11410 [Flavobacterium psychrophilum DSM 3660 = ATCC 49418]SCX84282.1 Uncharacterized conserved protein YodC, DUF2158 family [Flavobacterium psychrophilum DSM 3660] [Flavobacterium psychrophilum DSM 3660 = ATCC 49418]